jgi:hypothetical protein
VNSLSWHKSTFSGSSGSCVEVAELGETVLVRDTKDRDAGHLEFSARAWRALTEAIKADRI